MTDIMIDLETLSTQPDAFILSIGACQFDLTTGQIGDLMHRRVDLTETPVSGHIDPETVKWWLRQPKAAQDELLAGDTVSLENALLELSDFCRNAKTLWSNGASFDLVILRIAYERHGIHTPWQYWQERDTRTIVDIAHRLTGIHANKVTPYVGTQHDALADAIHQAKYVSHAYQLLQTNHVAANALQMQTGVML